MCVCVCVCVSSYIHTYVYIYQVPVERLTYVEAGPGRMGEAEEAVFLLRREIDTLHRLIASASEVSPLPCLKGG